MMGRPDFSDNAPLLAALGQPGAELIGYGGEARVYRLDAHRAIRILHPGATAESARARARFLAEIAEGARHLPFATPEIQEIVALEGRVAMIETLLPGEPFSRRLETAEGSGRENLLAAHLGAAERIAEIVLPQADFGDLLADPPVRRKTYRAYLVDRIAETRTAAGSLAPLLDPVIAEDMPDCLTGALVHFDLFPGNVMIADGAVSAVIDFGATAMIADPRVDLWAAVAYLDPGISPHARDADRAFAKDWLGERGLADDYRAARRWIAAYWCFAQDDPKVMAWCRSVLTGG